MKVKRENLEKNQVKLTIEVEKERLEKVSDDVYKKLAPSVKVAGFRPGKAPKDMVIKELGQQRFEVKFWMRLFHKHILKQ
jgi:trigger factor